MVTGAPAIPRPVRGIVAHHNRRARRRGRAGNLTAGQWLALCAHYDGRCLCCGNVRRLTVDHIVPTSRGGASTLSNVQPLCEVCNCAKAARIIDYRPEMSCLWPRKGDA